MPVTPKTQKYIWGLFAARCAMCKEPLIHEEADGESSLVGEIAHIVGQKLTAARGKHSLPESERDNPDNLLLLCRKHHKIVDDSELKYSVEALQSLRVDYLSWLDGQLADSEAWEIDISSFSYLNVPRLCEFAAINGYKIRLPEIPADAALRELGFKLNDVMESFRRTLESIAIRSVPALKVEYAHEGYIGQFVSFDRLRFRTKNIPNDPSGDSLGFTFSGDLSKDPHVYSKFCSWTLILNIDPRWITTSTAHSLFKPSGGASVFTGFARITDVDIENALMTATALAVGQPRPEFDIFSSKTEKTVGTLINLADLEDEITRSRGSMWLGDIDFCDFCGKSFKDECYMIDRPMKPGGLWGCMCEQCYQKSQEPLGIGKGQLYRRNKLKWMLVGGYPEPNEVETDD